MTKPKRSPSGDAMTELILDVFRLNGLLLAAGDRLTKDLGLTSARWQVLGALAAAKEPLTVAQIARNMGLVRQSVQRLVDVLAEEGILAFEDNPNHRRAKLVCMTEVGRHKFDQISQKQVRWANELSQGFEVEELSAAVALLREIQARLS